MVLRMFMEKTEARQHPDRPPAGVSLSRSPPPLHSVAHSLRLISAQKTTATVEQAVLAAALEISGAASARFLSAQAADDGAATPLPMSVLEHARRTRQAVC